MVWRKMMGCACAPAGRLLAAGLLLAALSWPAAAQDDVDSWRWADDGTSSPYAVAVFGGEGTERNFSETLSNPFANDTTSDRMLALAVTRELAWYRNMLSFEVEAMYAYHFDRETYSEFGGAVYARWHDFPWNQYLLTTFAVGLGPSYTTIYPELETQDNPDNRSRWLNQLNLEATFALPRYPSTSLMLRLQHRSGVFGTFGGVWDASNFLVIGLRQHF